MSATVYGGLQLYFEEEKENRYDDRYRKDVFRDPEQRFAEYGYHQYTIREKECKEQEQLVFTRAEDRSAGKLFKETCHDDAQHGNNSSVSKTCRVA